MEFGVLGPIRVTGPAGAVDIGGARQRRLLAALLLRAGEVTSTDRVLDIVFDGAPPAGAATTIRSYVARLRRALSQADPSADELIETMQGGYALRIDTDAIDAIRFEASIETARRQLGERDPIGAAATLRRGLAMWHGNAYEEFAFEEWAQPEAARLEELRAVAHEELNDALLASGLAHDVVSATRSQISEHPLRERTRAQHMLALYRAGRQVEALRSLEEFKTELIEVGLEPSDELLRLGRSIAAHDPALRLDSPAGQPLRGYRVGAALGEGAHGVVYRAVQPGVGREVAVKTIRAQLADDPDFVRRFDAEAQLVANLEHPHIVPIYDYWREPGGAYIVMRLLADNLGTRLAAGPLDVTSATTIARQLGGALATAHRAGVVHGDIKPSNVLVDESSAYLADFGVATLVESATGDGTSYSSSGYESPELLTGESPSPASDQFALAVLIVHLLTGQLPFGTRAIATPHDRTPSIHVQRPSVPAGVDDVMWKATAWDVADRYTDVESFIDHFEAAFAGRSEPESRDHQVANPYRGLRAFTEIDQTLFFGRTALVDELVDRLGRDGTEGRFVVAIGASGSGKSSIVRAGLLPKLRSGAVPGSDGWLIATMVPGSNPFDELSSALRSIATLDPGPAASGSGVPDHGEVARILDDAVPADQQVLLVIDQLEELFTQTADESTRRQFVDGITSAVTRPDANLRVVATMRADFLDRPLRYSEFGRLIKHGAVTVVGMSATELEAAVTRPAASVGVEVEPALATQLVADVLDQPAALPLLQFTLTELFEHRSGPVLTLRSYCDLGGVDAAVAGRAEAVFEGLTETERELARRMFLRLVNVDELRSVSRHRALRSELVSTANDPSQMDAVIDTFGTSRLLTFDHDPATREPTVEVAHEALIGQWPRFGEWVARAGDGLRIQGQLAHAARTWEQQGCDDSELYRGLRLESAQEWSAAQPDALNELERSFLDASVDARSAEVIAQREQSERDRRSNRRLRGLLAGVGVLLAVALVAGGLAIRQQQRADDEAASARAAAAAASDAAAAERAAADEAERQTDLAVAAVADADLATLISRSAAESSRNPELSLLLALEAQRRAPGTESEQAVLNALGTSRIPNQIATFPWIDIGSCQTPSFLGGDGLFEYAGGDGRLISLDLTTGEKADYGAAVEQCGVWMGDPSTNRVVTQCCGASRTWVGTFEDPYAVEVEHSAPWFMLDGDLGSNVAIFAEPTPGGGSARAVLLDVTTGEQIGEPIGRGDLITASADGSGSFVAVSTDDFDGGLSELLVLNAATGDQVFSEQTDVPAISFAWDRSNPELVAGMADGSVITVDLVTGEFAAPVPTTATAALEEVGVRPDGLIVAVSGGQVELVDRRSGPTGVVATLRDITEAWVRDDGTVVTLGVDGVYDVIEVDGNALVERSWPVDPFARVAFNDGKAGVLNSDTQAVTVVDLATGEQTDFDLRDSDGERLVVEAVYPESDGVLGVAASGRVARWAGSALVEQLDFPGRNFTGTRFEDMLATIGPDADGNVTGFLSSLEPGAARILFAVDAPDAHSAHPSIDGGLHVFDEDGTMHSYDESGEPLGRVDTGAEFVGINTMDATTGVLALASGIDGRIVTVDPSTGSVQRLPERNAVANLGFARDGQLLVITGFDGTVTVWDLERNAPAGLVWDGTGVRPSSPSWYDPESESIWVYTSGRLLEIPLSPERWVERACDIVGRDLTPDEWERFVPGDEPVQSACA